MFSKKYLSVFAAAGTAFVLALPLARSESPTPPRFDHTIHTQPQAQLECSSCHTTSAQADKVRPGKRDHTSCNAPGCHADAFYGGDPEKTTMCLVCHTNSVMWADMRELLPFPSEKRNTRQFVVEFSHRKHHTGPMRGKTETCDTCHHIDAQNRAYIPPSHTDCVQCHNETHQTPMSACSACHTPRVGFDGKVKKGAPSLRKSITRVTEHFSHENHRLDRRFAKPRAVPCGTCHGKASMADSVETIPLVAGRQTMEGVCRKCHNARQKTPDGRRIFGTRGASCQKCHSTQFMDLYYVGKLPTSH